MADSKPLAEIADLLGRSLVRASGGLSRRRQRPYRAVYDRADADPERFWADFASELEWSTPWTRVLEWNPPHAKWFVGGTLNASTTASIAMFAARGATRQRSSGGELATGGR